MRLGLALVINAYLPVSCGDGVDCAIERRAVCEKQSQSASLTSTVFLATGELTYSLDILATRGQVPRRVVMFNGDARWPLN